MKIGKNEKKTQNTDKIGSCNHLDQIVIDESDLIEMLYQDTDVSHVVVKQSDWIEKYHESCQLEGFPEVHTWELESKLTPEEFHQENLNDWDIPYEYSQLDIEKYVLEKCTTQEQRDRVHMEMAEYRSRNMIPILQFLKFFVDEIKANGHFLGVGRGSSVSSYVLYLLNIHKIDSLRYNLDIGEFLK